jgi:hypothetical protein
MSFAPFVPNCESSSLCPSICSLLTICLETKLMKLLTSTTAAGTHSWPLIQSFSSILLPPDLFSSASRLVVNEDDPQNTGGIESKLLDVSSLSYLPCENSTLLSHSSNIDESVILNIREVTSRISDVLWSTDKASLGSTLQSIGCDILWIFQKIGMLYVETHQQIEPLLLDTEDLFPKPAEKNGNSSTTQPPRSSQQSRLKKRITPTLLPPTNPISSCVSHLLPSLCHASDDYSIIADAELSPLLLSCDHHRLTRSPFPNSQLFLFSSFSSPLL